MEIYLLDLWIVSSFAPSSVHAVFMHVIVCMWIYSKGVSH